jgi:DNA-binding HxlR family transcriptional regulator
VSPQISDRLPISLARLADGVLTTGCPSRTVLNHVTSQWGVLVLVALSEGTLRWGELRRTVQGISEKMLAQTLRTLEADGLVHREAAPTIPPRVDYSLTDRGRALNEHLLPLMAWIMDNAESILDRSEPPGSQQ